MPPPTTPAPGDDPLATPIAKLPPPIVQMKSEQPAVNPPMYSDVLREMDTSRVTENLPTIEPIHRRRHSSSKTKQPVAESESESESEEEKPVTPRHRPSEHRTVVPGAPRDLRRAVSPPPAQSRGGLAHALSLSQNRHLVLLALIISAALYIALPRMKRMPRFVALDGNLSIVGIAALSVGITVVYRALSYGLDMTPN
jgi:hypothetical protein